MSAQNILKMTFAPVAIAILAAGLGLGCGSEGGGGGGNADQLASEGWDLFVTGEYNSAISKFQQAVGLDEDLEAGWNGLGWTYARVGNLEAADSTFLEVFRRVGNAGPDTYSGLAIVSLALKNYELASDQAGFALDVTGGNYEFRYDPTVTAVTMRLVRAISRFHQGLYVSAAADVVLLGGPALNQSAPDFVAKLLEAIQDRRELYGGGLLN
jgi:tetratricopeptide (TPR) repeat protein